MDLGSQEGDDHVQGGEDGSHCGARQVGDGDDLAGSVAGGGLAKSPVCGERESSAERLQRRILCACARFGRGGGLVSAAISTYSRPWKSFSHV